MYGKVVLQSWLLTEETVPIQLLQRQRGWMCCNTSNSVRPGYSLEYMWCLVEKNKTLHASVNPIFDALSSKPQSYKKFCLMLGKPVSPLKQFCRELWHSSLPHRNWLTFPKNNFEELDWISDRHFTFVSVFRKKGHSKNSMTEQNMSSLVKLLR